MPHILSTLAIVECCSLICEFYVVCVLRVRVSERDYQIFLSNRLLMGLCESEHSERFMIAKLKTECGSAHTR